MKKIKITYLVSTILFSLLMLMSAGMYLFNNEMVSGMFESFGYPTYIIYPLAFAKIAGLIIIWLPSTNRLKEWAYAGFFFDFVLAFFAHFMINDGEHMGAVIAIVLLLISYFSKHKLNA